MGFLSETVIGHEFAKGKLWAYSCMMFPSLLIIDSLLVLFMLFVVVRRLDTPGATPFFGLLAGVLLYNFGYAMELLTPPGVMSYFWTHFQYWGSCSLPAFWLWMSLETPFQTKLRRHWFYSALFLIPVITLALHLTNDWHHLYYTSLNYERVGDLTLAVVVRGPWYWVQLGYSVLVFALSLGFFAVRWGRLGHGYGKMALGLLGGTVFIWISVFVYQLGLLPGKLDLNPVGLTLAMLVYYRVLRPGRLFEMVPLSRELVFRMMPEPVLVLDRHYRLVDWNPALESLFPAFGQAQVGHTIEGLVTEYSWHETLVDPQFRAPVTLSHGSAPISWWTLVPTPVTDDGNRFLGRIVLLRNVTEEVAKDQLLARLDMTDPATGLFKGQTFRLKAYEQVDKSVRRAEPVSLVLFDLLGADDKQLKAAVDLWIPLIRSGHLLARLEASRLALLLPGLVPARALNLAEGLCTKLAKTRGGKARFGVAGLRKTESAPLDDLWTRAECSLNTIVESDPLQSVAGCVAADDDQDGACLEAEKGAHRED
jgi:GGDEF domain-containing protein